MNDAVLLRFAMSNICMILACDQRVSIVGQIVCGVASVVWLINAYRRWGAER